MIRFVLFENNNSLKKIVFQSGKIACIDYGKKFIGISVSDSTNNVALTSYLYNDDGKKKLIIYLCDLIKQNNIKLLVLGFPLNQNGTEGRMCQSVRDFQHYLDKSLPNLPMIFWDERFSSFASEQALKQMNVKKYDYDKFVDKMSATLILQSFLDYLNINIIVN